MRKLAMLMAGLAFFIGQVLAQNNRTITGKVSDENGKALAGVTVSTKGNAASKTVTDEQGNFKITVPESAKTLVFSSVGYGTKEVAITSASNFSINLQSATSDLEDVVVTGYQTIKKKDVSAAITRIGGDEIDNLPIPNFAQAIQGRAAGVAIAAANGIPGGSLSVIIRGIGSIGAGTAPLYVVDGVQINTGTGSINTQNNPLNFLNPDDIESIEILKDAAAASLYGARAGNGVVLVTTKKGKIGKPKFTVNTFFGTSSELKRLPALNTQDWYRVRFEALANANPRLNEAGIRPTVLSNLGLPSNFNMGKMDSLPSYDWQDAVFAIGNIASAEASVQGGGENATYYFSGAYSKQTAFVQPTSFERASLMSKINIKLSKKLTFDNSISLSSVFQNAPISVGNLGFGNPAYSAGMILPINPIYNPDGTFYGLPASGQVLVGTFNHNVVAAGQYANFNTRTTQIVSNASLTYKPTTELTIKSLVGLDYRQTKDQRYTDPRINDGFAVNGRLSSQTDWNNNFISTTTANFRKTYSEKHNVDVLAGVEYRRDANEWFQADGQGFPSYLLQYLSSAATPVAVSGQWTANATFSQFGKIGYNYMSKYIFNYTVRRDGSSRFGENNKYGIFQSVQAAWNVKEENFLKNSNVISDLKIRYSFGQTGNDQIGNVLYAQLYGTARIYGNGSAINPTQLGNPDLTWETREEHNLGLDVSFFKGRLNLTVDAYSRLNKDLLLARALYQTTGFSSIQQNLGAVQNQGIEILIEGAPIKNRDFTWFSSFNIAFQRNEVKYLYNDLQSLPSDASIRVGSPLGSVFTTRWAGVNPATGRGMWYDINGNITYNPTAADRVIAGDNQPDFFGGWRNSISFKNFSLEWLFQYEYGRLRADGQYQQMMRMGGATVNQLQSGFDERWQKPGDIATAPRPFNALADFNSAGWGTGTRYLFKADYIRLKQVTLGYDLSKSTAKQLGVDGARFYVQGLNLWTYTAWLGYDPEFTGDNFGILPQSRNITVGMQVRF
jgi:TonB-linked SusC/RagA family outer membrane protein